MKDLKVFFGLVFEAFMIYSTLVTKDIVLVVMCGFLLVGIYLELIYDLIKEKKI